MTMESLGGFDRYQGNKPILATINDNKQVKIQKVKFFQILGTQVINLCSILFYFQGKCYSGSPVALNLQKDKNLGIVF